MILTIIGLIISIVSLAIMLIFDKKEPGKPTLFVRTIDDFDKSFE